MKNPRMPYRNKFLKWITQREAAILWALNHRELWVGRKIERMSDGSTVTPAWMALVRGMKAAGIFSPKTYPYDIRINQIVDQARARIR